LNRLKLAEFCWPPPLHPYALYKHSTVRTIERSQSRSSRLLLPFVRNFYRSSVCYTYPF
jgi:hypothetical protein